MTPRRIAINGTDIANVAIQGVGHAYLFGGAPGVNGDQPWDCSSFCNWVIGAVWQQAIPGFAPGAYTGAVHGPSTLGWLGWQGQGVGSIDRSEVAAGDIACWQTHMGIALDNQRMVSAQTPSSGTQVGTIDGFIPGEQLIPLRLAIIGPGGITLPVPTIGGTAQIDQIARDIARATRNMVDVGTRLRVVGVRR